MQYRPEIDGLRAVAVLPVIFFHAGIPPFSGGYVGVDIFFVISGYLIGSILIKDLSKGTFSIIKFYERRARRIIPALFVVMAFCIPFSWFLLLPPDFVAFGKSLVAVPTFVSNILFWSERGYFGTATELKPLIHTWSLSVEEQFYILFPPLLAFLYVCRVQVRAAVFVATLLLSLLASWYLTNLHFETGFYLPMSRIWELLFGVGCAVYLGRYRPFAGIVGQIGAMIGLLLILYSIFFFDSQTVFPGLAALIPVSGTVLIIMCQREQNYVNQILSRKMFVSIGLISYSLYLWHQPIFAFLRHLSFDAPHIFAASLPFIFLVTFASLRYVEKPVRLAQNVSTWTVFTFTAAGSLTFIAIGAVIIMNRGFVDRYPQEDILIMEAFFDQSDFSERAFNRHSPSGLPTDVKIA